MGVTYSSYLHVDALLELQHPLSSGPEHDELLFIVIHQVYELWFKQILHELDYLQAALEAGDAPLSQKTLHRVRTILKTIVGQVDILETMTPLSFNAFRERLDTASGFQSTQFRMVEFALGHRGRVALKSHPSPQRERLEAYLSRPSIYDSYLRFLASRGHPIPADIFTRDLATPHQASEAVQQVLLEVYKRDAVAVQLSEQLLDMDQGLQEWRYRHIKMVERTIGAKVGTGGSAGAEYLKATLFKPVFEDLWAIRHRM